VVRNGSGARCEPKGPRMAPPKIHCARSRDGGQRPVRGRRPLSASIARDASARRANPIGVLPVQLRCRHPPLATAVAPAVPCVTGERPGARAPLAPPGKPRQAEGERPEKRRDDEHALEVAHTRTAPTRRRHPQRQRLPARPASRFSLPHLHDLPASTRRTPEAGPRPVPEAIQRAGSPEGQPAFRVRGISGRVGQCSSHRSRGWRPRSPAR
jgi:hypothetical protein